MCACVFTYMFPSYTAHYEQRSSEQKEMKKKA